MIYGRLVGVRRVVNAASRVQSHCRARRALLTKKEGFHLKLVGDFNEWKHESAFHARE